MLILEQIMEIKVLYKQGKSLRTIAGEVGVSVNTVRKYLKHEGTPKYKVRPPLVTKLGPYKEYLSNRIKSAHPLPLPGTVLFQEIKDHGYKGGITQLRDYLRSIKPVAEPWGSSQGLRRLLANRCRLTGLNSVKGRTLYQLL